MSPGERAETVRLLKNLRHGRTLVVVEHDMDAVFELADRLTVMADGQVIASGLPQEVRLHPAVRTAYLGDHGDAA
jgi:branched-chain amino acid transport system ATP-binding protein